MKAECVICMERFQSSEAISASECGHVFHQACIVRWLNESCGFSSIGNCPQCRSSINKVRLTRLFFTDSSVTSTATVNQRDIDKLQARITLANKCIAELTADCRRKDRSIEELIDDCEHKDEIIDELTDDCKQKDEFIDDLTDDCRRKYWSIEELIDDCEHRDEIIDELRNNCAQKDKTIASLTNLYCERNDSLAEQTSRVKQLANELE